MAAQSQSTPLEESVEETVEVQESETFADDTVDLDETIKKTPLGPKAQAAKDHITAVGKKHGRDFGAQRMHIDDFPSKYDKKTQDAAKQLNKHQYGGVTEEESIEEVDKGFGSRMKAADAAANIYSKEKRKPENDTIRAIRKKYADKKKEEQVDEKMDAFDRSMRATVRGGKTADYIQKKAKERSDLNKKNDPSMAKKGYALSVTDREKAMKKARDRGLDPKYPTQKYGKRKLPEEMVDEKTLTPAEKKKREEVAKAIERDNPDMPMDKKMAIATATAKKVAESSISDQTKKLIERAINRKS